MNYFVCIFIDVLTPANRSQTSGFTQPLWVIRQSLHIYKIHKNKIRSYNFRA